MLHVVTQSVFARDVRNLIENNAWWTEFHNLTPKNMTFFCSGRQDLMSVIFLNIVFLFSHKTTVLHSKNFCMSTGSNSNIHHYLKSFLSPDPVLFTQTVLFGYCLSSSSSSTYSSKSCLQQRNGQDWEGHRADSEHLLGQPARDIFIYERIWDIFIKQAQHEVRLKRIFKTHDETTLELL